MMKLTVEHSWQRVKKIDTNLCSVHPVSYSKDALTTYLFIRIPLIIDCLYPANHILMIFSLKHIFRPCCGNEFEDVSLLGIPMCNIDIARSNRNRLLVHTECAWWCCEL